METKNVKRTGFQKSYWIHGSNWDLGKCRLMWQGFAESEEDAIAIAYSDERNEDLKVDKVVETLYVDDEKFETIIYH